MSTHHASSSRRLGLALGLVLVYMAAELVGGWLTNSLALLADAGHMLADAGSLALALFALRMARRPRTPERTFGYYRTEILAALINGATLVAIAIFIGVEAWQRLQAPPAVHGPGMFAVAAGGIVVNLCTLWILHGERDRSLNLRGAWLHVLTDTLGSVQAVVAGALIWGPGWQWADPVASLLIAVLVIWSSWSLLRDTVHVLMEATPRHIDATQVARAISGVEGVEQVHDLHIWTIASGFEALSAHARVRDRDRDEVLTEVRGVVRRRFGIRHSTLQLEGDATECAGCPPARPA